MKYPWAVPGRKVVCVDASLATAGPPPNSSGWTGLIKVVPGEIYTIRSVQVDRFGRPSVLLVELPKRSIFDAGYFVGRFRPLHTLEDDVALFAELLTPAPNAPMLPEKEHVR